MIGDVGTGLLVGARVHGCFDSSIIDGDICDDVGEGYLDTAAVTIKGRFPGSSPGNDYAV